MIKNITSRVRGWLRRRPAIKLIHGDITTQNVDAIVNAAKSSLLGGSGVDGAIHAAAGPNLLAACQLIRATSLPTGLGTGNAIATDAFRLPAQYVIHTVGPIYSATLDRSAKLRACYTNSLAVADDIGASSVAFPLISSGVYGWPTEDAIVQAVTAIRSARTRVKAVRLVLFSDHDFYLAKRIVRNPKAYGC